MLLLVVGIISIPAFADDDDINDRYDDRDEYYDERYDERYDESYDDRHENRVELHSQHSTQMTVLEDRIIFLEKQIEGKDSIIAEQMKVIMMLVEQINKVVFDQIMMPKFGI